MNETITFTQTILSNMLFPQVVAQRARKSKNPYPLVPNFQNWNGASLCSGFAGILLMLTALAKKGFLASPDDVIHRYVLAMKEEIERDGISSLSLFSGVCGQVFALEEASLRENRYQKMIDILDQFLLDHLEKEYLLPFNQCKQQNLSPPSLLYDVIQGVSGVGRYLLDKVQEPRIEWALKSILSVLVDWTRPRLVYGKTVPGWYLSPKDTLNQLRRYQSEKGNFNLGLSHGITGVLALFAIASLKGVEVSGQRESMDYIQHWMRKKSFEIEGNIHWPHSISWEEEVGETLSSKDRSKDAWCYGVPGIARTLYLTGKALQNNDLIEFAKQAFRGIFQREERDWELPGPNLCHGIAGLLSITKRMSDEEGCEEFIPEIVSLKAKLMKHASEDAFWIFQDPERTTKGNWYFLDKPGFLEGAAGIVLTLATLSDPNPRWHLPLMIHV